MDLPRTPSFRLDGRRVLVAGASSGIGLGCAVAVAEAGAEVTLAARRADRLQAIAAQLEAAGWSARSLPIDIADVAAVDAAVTEHGPFDVLVNSAGLARHAPLLEITPETYDSVMAVNLRGALFLARAVARSLIEAAKPGSIITISSQMGVVGGIDRAVYCASKHGVEGFTKAMALELGPHRIRINTICPTFIRTPLTEPTFDDPERVRWLEERIKLGRVGEVEDIMGAAVYLASAASGMVTGTALMIDGGWTAD